MKTIAGVIFINAALLLAGCGEQLSDQTQKAVDQIKGEASKLASKQIESFKTDAVGQLKKLQGVAEKEKSDEKSSGKQTDTNEK